MATVATLMTIEEYLALPETGTRTELVRGVVIELSRPGYEHGKICIEISFLITLFVKQSGSGRVIGNDSGIITHRDPDSLRGADVAYYSAVKANAIGVQKGYPNLAPDLVVEVRSPSDRWSEMVHKAGEYLAAGVLVVVLLDPDTRSAHVFEADRAPRAFGPQDTLTFPDLLGDFAVVVGRIFD